MENSFTTAPLVCLRDVVVRDINRDDQVVRSATGDRVLILPRWITRAFLHCVAFAPLPQHLAREARLFKWTEAQVRTAASHFTRALEAGFFLAQGDVLAVSQHREKPGTIAFIGVPTCNRVDSLMRMIRSMVQHENPFHTTLSFVVMDDSSDSHKRQRVRDALHWLKNELGFHVAYAGLEEKSAWAQQLAETSGVERMIVDYGLFDVLETHANQPGSNRNALLLHGAEDMFLSCDDDLVIPPSGFCQPTRLTWQTAGDPTQFRFAPPATSGEEASPDLSLLNYHERYLGREIAFIQHDIPGAGIDVRGPGRHCLPTSYGLSPFVVSTWTGFSGDCGMSALSPLLTLATHNHAPLVADENAYHRTFQFRQLSRFVTEPTLARCDNYQAMCTGVDHRHPLPPFFPNIRSQDTLFAWMTLRQSPNAWFAFLPPILTHNREPRRQSMPNWAALEAATVPFQLIMLKLLDTHQPARLAEFFAQLGTMPPNEFRHLMRTTRWDVQCDRLAAVDHALRTATPAPDFWRRDLLQFQTGVLAALQAEPQETPQASQREFQLFAQLLEAWPALVRSAAALRRNGNPLARSL